jgi:hypothetical protein
MPKCATSAIQRGFDNIGRPALHAHNNPTLYDAFANGVILREAAVGISEIVRLRLAANPRPFHIFFGYREPVSWYLSLAGHFGLELDDTLARDFLSNLKSGYPWVRYPIQDTLDLIESSTGIDIWKASFDTRQGYSVLENGNARLVLYRFDRLSELEAMIVQDIDPAFRMRRERTNEDPVYRRYVSNVRLSAPTLKQVFAGRFFDYFYTPRERDLLFARWSVGDA